MDLLEVLFDVPAMLLQTVPLSFIGAGIGFLGEVILMIQLHHGNGIVAIDNGIDCEFVHFLDVARPASLVVGFVGWRGTVAVKCPSGQVEED
jgi:hypothetical protein